MSGYTHSVSSRVKINLKRLAYTGLISMMTSCFNPYTGEHPHIINAQKIPCMPKDGTLYNNHNNILRVKDYSKKSYHFDTLEFHTYHQKTSKLESKVQKARNLADSAFNRFMNNYTQGSFGLFDFPKTYRMLKESEEKFALVRVEAKEIEKYIDSFQEISLDTTHLQAINNLQEKVNEYESANMKQRNTLLKQGYHNILYSFDFKPGNLEKNLSSVGVDVSLAKNTEFMNAAKRDRYLLGGGLLLTILTIGVLWYKDVTFDIQRLKEEKSSAKYKEISEKLY